MKFHIEGFFKTSSNPEAVRVELETFFTDAETTILAKGAPDGKGAKVISWQLHDNGIDIVMESDRYVRAHDGMIRLRKPMGAVLGKQKIGIRGIDIKNFTISVESEKPLEKLTIPFVTKMDYADGMITLTLDMNESGIQNKVPDRILKLLDDKIAAMGFGGKGEHWKLMWESGKKNTPCNTDPTQDLIKKGWIKHGASRGQWIYGPEAVAFFKAFERIVIDEIIKPLGYFEMIFPKLVTWDVWQKSGHAKGVYPEIYYVCPPKTRDPDFWEEVSDYYKVTNEVDDKMLDMIQSKIGKPIGGMCYAQCPPSWGFFEGETIATESLPLRFYDRSGTSHRYESGGIHGIERVDEFHRIEIVWCGMPEQVVAESKKLQVIYKHIFEDILELEWRQAWVTPWFMAQEGLTGLSGSEEVGTIDYEAFTPYKGVDSEWMEFQNLSVNGDKYPKGFNVKSQSGEQLWSGCSGIGLERWTAAFLSQKGLDRENWPQAFRDIMGEMPKDFVKFL